MVPLHSRLVGFLLLGLAWSAADLHAASIIKGNNGNALNSGSSWVGGVAPGPGDIATWDATYQQAGLTVPMGGNVSWLGIKFGTATTGSPGFSTTIGGGGTITLGIGGIDLSNAAPNLNFFITPNIVLAQGNQVWMGAAANQLSLAGTLSRVTGATVTISGTAGEIDPGSSDVNVNGIAGPWMVISNTGAGAVGSPAGFTYATISGRYTPYTSATQETNSAAAWGGIPSGGNGTVNYDVSAGGNLGATGLPRVVNTIRYTGTGAAQVSNNVMTLLTVNGVMNAGTGPFALGSGTGGFGSFFTAVGQTNELVVAAETAPIAFFNAITDGTTGSGAVTITGTSTVTLGGNNSYTGATTVSGNLLLTGTIATSAGITIRAGHMEADGLVGVTTSVSGGGVLTGTGSVNAITVADGTLAPGLTAANALLMAGALKANGSVSLSGSAAFAIRLGTASPTDTDELLMTTGNVSLAGANLMLSLGPDYATQPFGTDYVVIDGSAAGSTITGQFAQGPTIIASNGDFFNIYYDVNPTATGPGSDVVLQRAVPEPSTWSLLAGALVVCGVARRRKVLKN